MVHGPFQDVSEPDSLVRVASTRDCGSRGRFF